MIRPSQLAVLALAAALAGRAPAQAPLTKDSPFLPPAGSAEAAPAANESLTLTGVSGLGKNALVCIYDTQAKRGYWIPVGTTTEGIKVLNYDNARDQAVITVGGQQKLLTLRNSSIANAGSNPGQPAPSFASPTTAMPTPTQGTPQPPPPPGSVAQQETEARMLVSDLLEIGMQQRKAYEEAQKKAQAEKKKS